jgi:branched-chain amino acid transport system permease protein
MQILVNGLVSGATIALLALAFSLVHLPTRIFHIALGAVYALCPFVAWSFWKSELPGWIGISVAVVAGVILSVLCERFNHARLERSRASPGLHLISSLGVYIAVVETISIAWGSETKVLRQGIDTAVSVGGIMLTKAQILCAVVGVLLISGILFWLWFSTLGLRLRALADNPTQLALFGYNTPRLRLLAFAVAGFLAASASLLVSYDVGFDPRGGLQALLLAVVAVIVGGRNTWMGPVVAGFLVGTLRAQVSWHLSARWQDAATYLLLAVILLFRPQGLFGKAMRLEASE